jgi:hypothetical protein
VTGGFARRHAAGVWPAGVHVATAMLVVEASGYRVCGFAKGGDLTVGSSPARRGP